MFETLQRVFKCHGMASYHKPINTLRTLLVNPKDKTDKSKQCGVVYSLSCEQWNAQYIGEKAQTVGAMQV